MDKCSERLLWGDSGWQCQLAADHHGKHQGYWAAPFLSQDMKHRRAHLPVLGAFVEWTAQVNTNEGQ